MDALTKTNSASIASSLGAAPNITSASVKAVANAAISGGKGLSTVGQVCNGMADAKRLLLGLEARAQNYAQQVIANQKAPAIIDNNRNTPRLGA